MLAALAAIGDKPALDLRCIHVEHGIRPMEESRGDAEFVRSLCEKFNIPCSVVSIPPGKVAALARARGIGIEAAARFFRRRAWFREAGRLEEGGKPALIVTAHTADDALETALMRLLCGAGPAGLAAMPVKRGRLLRPLLAVGRADVIAYLGEKNIPWREDSTNADTRFLRNRVRHCLVPQLNELFPGWRKGLAAFAETQSLAAAFIRAEAGRRIVWTQAAGGPCTEADLFFAQSAIVREEALFQALDRFQARRKKNASPHSPLPIPHSPLPKTTSIRRSTIRHFCAGKVQAADLGPARVQRENGRIVIAKGRPPDEEYGFSLLIKESGSYNLKGVAINVEVCSIDECARGGIIALLPLALRKSFAGDLLVNSGRKIQARDLGRGCRWTALDVRGTAAFIGSGGVIRHRDFFSQSLSKGEQERLCRVTIMTHNGSIHA
jgi:tRNA(Ile)-lysidine synthase